MERLTARNDDGTAYYPECFKKDGCCGEGCSKDECDFFDVKCCNKLAEYEDREEFLEKQVYFILNDKLAENKIKGDYYVSSPHSVIDVSTMGFWVGNPEDFPFETVFTRWDEEYFTSYQEAKEAIERMVIE